MVSNVVDQAFQSQAFLLWAMKFRQNMHEEFMCFLFEFPENIWSSFVDEQNCWQDVQSLKAHTLNVILRVGPLLVLSDRKKHFIDIWFADQA